MAENIASLVNSLAKGVMLESGDANIQAYYGPYTSLDNAVAFFQNNVEPYLLYVPAGYKVGIGTQETVGGLPTWTSITQEYIYIGGGISKAHFVPVIMSLDTEYTTLKTKVNGIDAGAEVNVVKSVDTTATAGVNLSLASGKLDVTVSGGSIASGNGNVVTGGTVYAVTSILAPKESPALIGTPTAPTAVAGTNTTQIATTAFVANAVGDTVDEVSLDQNYTNKVNIGYTLTKGGGGTLEIGAATDTKAGVMTKDDRLLLNELIPVVNSGGWNIDENYQVGGTTESGSPQSTIPEGLETRLTRIEAILGDLYDDDDDSGASDGHIEIS